MNRGCNVTVYPCDFDADEVIASKPDGIMITNGPGDPAECVEIIEQIKKLSENDNYTIVESKTAFGISLYDHIALDGSAVKENQTIRK